MFAGNSNSNYTPIGRGYITKYGVDSSSNQNVGRGHNSNYGVGRGYISNYGGKEPNNGFGNQNKQMIPNKFTTDNHTGNNNTLLNCQFIAKRT